MIPIFFNHEIIYDKPPIESLSSLRVHIGKGAFPNFHECDKSECEREGRRQKLMVKLFLFQRIVFSVILVVLDSFVVLREQNSFCFFSWIHYPREYPMNSIGWVLMDGSTSGMSASATMGVFCVFAHKPLRFCFMFLLMLLKCEDIFNSN